MILTMLELAAFGQAFTAQELHALTFIREADLGIERVYLDQYSFYYELPPGLVTPMFEQRGALLWRYDGQNVYSDEPDDGNRTMTWTEPDYILTGLSYDPDAYLGVGYATRTDLYGRRWVLDSVDHAAAEASVEAYNAEVEAQFGVAEPGAESNPGIEYNPDGGTVHIGTLQSWTTIWCAGEEHFIDHSSDDFSKSNTIPLNDRQRKIVFIIIDDVGICTGTMVDSNTVLTAAHCLTTDSGTQFAESKFTVCSMENLDENTTGSHEAACFSIVDVDPAPNWNGGDNSTVVDDYGLLHLDGVPGNGWFALSEASDSYINNFPDFLRGYPPRERDCDYNEVSGAAVTDTPYPYGHHLYGADGDIQGTPSGWVKYDTSSAEGSSGGPHFYCPNGSGCDDGHYITGVHSGDEVGCSNEPCATGYTFGAKARDIREWVINNM
jgi:hypothetical protein